MTRQVVRSEVVVEGRGLYSNCVRAGDLLFIAGQVAWDRDGKIVGRGDLAAQGRRCFESIRALVSAAGGTLDDVVKVTMYLTDVSRSRDLRPVRAELFQDPYPAWTTVGVHELGDPELLIEVDAVAYLGRPPG